MILALLCCLAVILAFGVAERLARDRAWRAVPIRLHVNGTRGKSTVTRLLWSALREAGIPVVGKTTGTAARLLLPDGSERAVGRRAPPSIREQLAVLRLAHRLGARAVVVECMALDPELQALSERSMVHATIGVITNVRLDHTEVMGTTLESIAATLANTIPAGGTVVSGEERFLALFTARAERLGARVVSSSGAARVVADRVAAGLLDPLPRWLADDMSVALAATRELGIADEVALRGFALAPADPGAARSGTFGVAGETIDWVDLTAANDPESLALAEGDLQPAGAARRPSIVVYNHRLDRGARLACFARRAELLARADRLVITGARPAWTVARVLAGRRPGRSVEYVRVARLPGWLRRQPAGARVIFCGNTRGLDVGGVLAQAASDG